MRKLLLILTIIILIFSACSSPNPISQTTTIASTNKSTDVSESTAISSIVESKETDIPPINSNVKIEMQAQKYIVDNIVEIPSLVYEGTNTEAEKINNKIQVELVEPFKEFIDNPPVEIPWAEIKTYPFSNDKYLQIAVTAITYPNYATHGEIYSYVYDIEAGKEIDIEKAYQKVGLSEAELAEKIKNEYKPEYKESVLKSMEFRGFRYEDDNVFFYINASFEHVDTEGYTSFLTYSFKDNKITDYDLNVFINSSNLDNMTPALYYEKAKQ